MVREYQEGWTDELKRKKGNVMEDTILDQMNTNNKGQRMRRGCLHETYVTRNKSNDYA